MEFGKERDYERPRLSTGSFAWVLGVHDEDISQCSMLKFPTLLLLAGAAEAAFGPVFSRGASKPQQLWERELSGVTRYAGPHCGAPHCELGGGGYASSRERM